MKSNAPINPAWRLSGLRSYTSPMKLSPHWYDLPTLTVRGRNPHLECRLSGSRAGLQLIRRGRESFAWTNIAPGRRLIDLRWLHAEPGFQPRAGDGVYIRAKALGEDARLRTHEYRLVSPPLDEIIFEDEDLQVIYHPGNSNYTLITFSPMDMPVLGHNYWCQTLVVKESISTIGFVAKRAHWYLADSMRAAIDAAKRTRRGQVITYGSSMGAYGALKWAERLGATGVVAIAPQYSIDPNLAPFDHRYTDRFDPRWHSNMALDAADCASRALIIYDPTDAPDAAHADLICQKLPNARRVPIKGPGHRMAYALAGTRTAKQLFTAARTGDVRSLGSLVDRCTGDVAKSNGN